MASELLSKLGLDAADTELAEAVEDAEALADLVSGLVTVRKQLGIRQTDLAELLQTSQSAVSDFERIGGDPRLSTIQRYARALGTRIRLGIDGYTLVEGAWVDDRDPRAAARQTASADTRISA